MRDWFAAEEYLARGRSDEARDQIEERGFAGTVGTDHRAQFAFAYRKIDGAIGREGTEAFFEPLGLKDRIH